MVKVTDEQLESAVRASGLFEPDRLESVVAALRQQGGPRVLQQLASDGQLTAWQARRLLAGHAHFRVGNYRLEDQLTASPAQVVFQAIHETHAAPARLIQVTLESDSQRCRREFHRLSKLRHPALVPLVEIHRTARHWYLGYHGSPRRSPAGVEPTTAAQAELAQPVPATLLAGITSLADGVAYAHRHQIADGRLSEDRIVWRGNQPSILEFGLPALIEKLRGVDQPAAAELPAAGHKPRADQVAVQVADWRAVGRLVSQRIEIQQSGADGIDSHHVLPAGLVHAKNWATRLAQGERDELQDSQAMLQRLVSASVPPPVVAEIPAPGDSSPSDPVGSAVPGPVVGPTSRTRRSAATAQMQHALIGLGLMLAASGMVIAFAAFLLWRTNQDVGKRSDVGERPGASPAETVSLPDVGGALIPPMLPPESPAGAVGSADSAGAREPAAVAGSSAPTTSAPSSTVPASGASRAATDSPATDPSATGESAGTVPPAVSIESLAKDESAESAPWEVPGMPTQMAASQSDSAPAGDSGQLESGGAAAEAAGVDFDAVASGTTTDPSSVEATSADLVADLDIWPPTDQGQQLRHNLKLGTLEPATATCRLEWLPLKDTSRGEAKWRLISEGSRGWMMMSTDAQGVERPTLRVALNSDGELICDWQVADVPAALASLLANSWFQIRYGDNAHLIALRSPVRQPRWTLDLQRAEDRHRYDLTPPPPDDLKFEITELGGLLADAQPLTDKVLTKDRGAVQFVLREGAAVRMQVSVEVALGRRIQVRPIPTMVMPGTGAAIPFSQDGVARLAVELARANQNRTLLTQQRDRLGETRRYQRMSGANQQAVRAEYDQQIRTLQGLEEAVKQLGTYCEKSRQAGSLGYRIFAESESGQQLDLVRSTDVAP